MRLVVGVALLAHGLTGLSTRMLIAPAIPEVLAIAAGILLLAGLWTPIVGSVVAILGLWDGISQSGDLSANIFLATIGAALAMLGPGAWSVDARLFGWKRIDVGHRKS
jgi:putative oxidoreductase